MFSSKRLSLLKACSAVLGPTDEKYLVSSSHNDYAKSKQKAQLSGLPIREVTATAEGGEKLLCC